MFHHDSFSPRIPALLGEEPPCLITGVGAIPLSSRTTPFLGAKNGPLSVEDCVRFARRIYPDAEQWKAEQLGVTGPSTTEIG